MKCVALLRRFYCQKLAVTTPIFYVNSKPHVGHLYTALLADTFTRWKKLTGQDVVMSIGTDEHGSKVLKAAQFCKEEPLKFCNRISHEFKNLFDHYNVDYDHFIRTTDAGHMQTVHHFWNLLSSKGLIYKGQYSGWYSVREECFISGEDLVIANDGTATSKSGEELGWVEEENYIFNILSLKYQLREYWKEIAIFPRFMRKSILKSIKDLNSNISISRSSSRVGWGIDVPDDRSQKIYVWFEALLNYLTITGYPNCLEIPRFYHILGKDILWFHAVIWPAMLIGGGLQPPIKLIVHNHFLIRDSKMSKSLGNVIDPSTVFNDQIPDAVRYFLLRGNLFDSDYDYKQSAFKTVVNAELCNSIGNLLTRISSEKLNPRRIFPPFTSSDSFLDFYFEELTSISNDVVGMYEEFRVYQVMERLILGAGHFNSLVTKSKPWELMEINVEKTNNVLYLCYHFLRVCGVVLSPIIPNLSTHLLDTLNIPQSKRTFADIAGGQLGRDECEYSCRQLRIEFLPFFKRL